MQEREILHCDCNGFYASVECVLNPKLRNVAMAVGGNERDRHGIILAKNEIAKKYNIKTAETIWPVSYTHLYGGHKRKGNGSSVRGTNQN